MLNAAMLFARVSGLLKRIPWQAYAIAAALAFVALYGRHREAQGRYEGRAEIQAQWDRARKEGEAIRAKEEARQAKLSKEADRAVIEKGAAERDRAESFIRAGGVRNNCPRTVNTPLPSTGEREAVREAPVVDDGEALPTVAVTPEDVRICTANTLKAEAWRDLLLGLEGGAAKVVAGE